MSERRAIAVRIDRRELAQILQFPDDVHISSVHFDPFYDALILRIEGEKFEPVPEGMDLTVYAARYVTRPDDDSYWLRFDGFR